jgi:serine phosphatase RsbU (regulator of sigma subunit)/pSer/pThr/pTyr-binding forkhead associated (FHA) protein
MPALLIRQGPNAGTSIPLNQDRFVIGRNPDCGVIIPVTSVSREHATIVRLQGRYFIEDGDGRGNRSRNHTFVNKQKIDARTALRNNDEIRICDFVATFVDPQAAGDTEGEADADQTTSTVEAVVSGSSNLLLETQPADRLRGLLEITGNLSKTLELEALLPKIVDSLFHLFRQADRAFLILAEDAPAPGSPPRLLPKVIKTRRAAEESTARFSRSIVRQCLEQGQAFLSGDATKDDRVQLSQSVVDFRIRSVMCAPLSGVSGKPFGVIQLDTQDRSKKFSEDDLKFLCGVANQASIAMENARLHEGAVAQARVERDLKIAHQVQLSFLPKTLPLLAGYDFAAHYQPALAVGGDYYGFIPMPDGQLAVAVGDVAGKGVSAALMMAKLSSEARYCVHTEADPARAVCKLNDLLAEFMAQADKFVTLALAVLDPVRHDVRLVSAGHPSPLLVRRGAGGPIEVVPKRDAGMPLGIAEGSPYGAVQLPMQPGDALLLFTDGVTDAENTEKKPFGLEGVCSVLRGATGPKGAVEGLRKAVQAHAAGTEPFDDITVVSLGRIA